jgi:hypothetical protein
MSLLDSSSSWLTTLAPDFSSGSGLSRVRFQTAMSQPPLREALGHGVAHAAGADPAELF